MPSANVETSANLTVDPIKALYTKITWKLIPFLCFCYLAAYLDRINIGFALVGAVVGEFISSQRGLGHLIYAASSLYDLNTVWVGLFVLMFVGFLLYHVIDFAERRILPWRQVTTAGLVQV